MAAEFDLKRDVGDLLIEGKTKKVHLHKTDKQLVVVFNKDQITAGDGARRDVIEGKAEIATKTNGLVFDILNAAGVPTAYKKQVSPTVFLASRTRMVPIEWVTRRLATGSYLKRHPGTHECFRFIPPCQETFYKDDANHDPQWSDDQILCGALEGVGRDEIAIMKRISFLVFEILEKVWAKANCVLVDMKIEFGFDTEGSIVVADVIDSDSWRLWPCGKKELMKDKQVYRNLEKVTAENLTQVKLNYTWIADTLASIQKPDDSLAVVVLGSSSDLQFSKTITNRLEALGVPHVVRICSAHKSTAEALSLIAEYEGSGKKIVFIAVAGLSNGLGPVCAGNTCFPVINCPRLDESGRDIWSSVNTPTGIACSTITSGSNAAIAAAQVFALDDVFIWAKLRASQTNFYTALKLDDMRNRGRGASKI